MTSLKLLILVLALVASSILVESELRFNSERFPFDEDLEDLLDLDFHDPYPCFGDKDCYRDQMRRRKAKENKVQVVLCFESLCPDCKNFITNQLYPVYQSIGSIINWHFIPYGNAQERKVAPTRWEFDCQHGPEECVGNMIETCAAQFTFSMDRYIPWLHCVESSKLNPLNATHQCASKHPDIRTQKVLDCALEEGGMGNHYEHEMALMTDLLCPNHTWVPWVTIDGKHSKAAETNLLEVVCDAYTGTKPSGCQGL